MRYFTIEELVHSDYATLYGIDNRPDEKSMHSLRVLVQEVLDPLRDAYGAPIYVNSGYRCPELNRAVGGSPGSHHLRGMAADITTGSRQGNRRLFDLVVSKRLKYTQLIDEKNFSWLHISYDPSDLSCRRLRL